MQEWIIQNQKTLSSQLQSGTLPHALLITGVQGSGTESLAGWLTATFNCLSPVIGENDVLSACTQCKTCLLSQSQTNPDTINIKSDDKNISVEDIRAVTRFLETKPQLAKGKSVYIADAYKLTVSAANALLKTLEEPNDNSLIVLTSIDIDSLLPTIISRCQLVALRPYVGQQLAEASSELNDPYLNIRHVSELNDASLKTQYIDFCSAFSDLIEQGNFSSELERAMINTEQGLDWLERSLINISRMNNNWQVSNCYNEIRVSLPSDIVWKIYQLVISAKKKLKSLVQANPTFVKEQLVADIKRLITS